jgi:tetratricopeptide (TPR) repeat protein
MHLKRGLLLAGSALALALVACEPGAMGPREFAAADDMPGTSARVGRSSVPIGASSAGNYLAGRHAQVERDFDSAAGFLDKALKDDPANLTLMRQAYRLKLASGEVGAATDLAKRIVKVEPRSALANLGLIAEDVKAGRMQDAYDRSSAMPEQGLGTFLGPLTKAWTLAGLGKTDEAIAALGPLRGITGLSVLYDLHVGLIEDIAGRTDAAVASFKSAAGTNGESALRIVEALGSIYERTGHIDDARRLYQKYVGENPDSVVLEPALKRVESGGKAQPIVANARQGLAEALLNLGGTFSGDNTAEVALVCGRLAIYLRPDLDLARMLVAGILESQGGEREANKLYEEVPKGSSLRWLARLRHASNLDSLGETDAAIAELSEMSNEKPDRVDALINLGDLLRSHKRFKESVEAYDKAFARLGEIGPRYWSLLYSRGISLERSGQWPRAEADLEKALKLNPDEPYVLNYLGYSWADKGVHLDKARKMIERAVELRPTDGYIVDSLGWLLFRTGHYKEAVTNLERAVELKPQDPVINDHLGDAYWRVGRTKEARYQWQRALALEPDADLVSEIKNKIVRGLAAVTPRKSNNDI